MRGLLIRLSMKNDNNRGLPKKVKAFFALILLILPILTISVSLDVSAEENKEPITGIVYQFDDGKDYSIAEAKGHESTGNGNSIGEFFIKGKVKRNDGDANSFIVEEGKISFDYDLNQTIKNRVEDDWKLSEDSAKKVNGVDFGEKIKKGAILVQSSLNGEKWVENVLLTDIFANSDYIENIYTTNELQQINGCYFRVTVAYELRKRVKNGVVDKYDYKNVAEVYEFYVEEKSGENEPKSTDTPIQRLGETVNAGLDTGFSGNDTIDINNPHYGWELGSFYINGYTSIKNDNGTNRYLKTIGDRVVLWFKLNDQNLNGLNGNSKIIINEDENGYDEEFGIKKTNFKHGALIIEYTDSQNQKHVMGPYTDFLAACATTTADTRVQLFEEGDYKVHLDYEIKDSEGLKPVFYNYKISFEFSIRNGDAMVFPREINPEMNGKMGRELDEGNMTSTGFMLDMARSKYLTLSYKRSEIGKNEDGTVFETVRENQEAKENREYTDEGIYDITVKNEYTEKSTTKRIFVDRSNNKIMLVMSKKGLSADELNEFIKNGSTITEDGEVMGANLPNINTEGGTIPVTTQTGYSQQSNTEGSISDSSASGANAGLLNGQSMGGAPVIIIIVIVLLAVLVILFVVSRRIKKEKLSSGSTTSSENNSNENEVE